MDCAQYGNISVVGNFAELQQSKPEPFDYDKTAKWLEDYPFEFREVLGDATCSCVKVEVHYAPYYGWDYYHQKTCSLMRKLAAEPQIHNLRETYLPAINNYTDSKKNDGKLHIWVENKTKHSKKVNVVRNTAVHPRQAVLV